MKAKIFGYDSTK